MTKEEELLYLKEKCLFIVNFMIQTSETPIISLEQTKEIIQDVFEKNNLKGLKIIHHDLNEWKKALKQKDIKDLNTLLKNNFN